MGVAGAKTHLPQDGFIEKYERDSFFCPLRHSLRCATSPMVGGKVSLSLWEMV
ncbi:MAG: hypothetical protein IJX13_06010 [Clostridia bacterium]|nr:hypothetical protein [Clostridia bacterium]